MQRARSRRYCVKLSPGSRNVYPRQRSHGFNQVDHLEHVLKTEQLNKVNW